VIQCNGNNAAVVQSEHQQQSEAHAYKVTVLGAIRHPAKKDTFIVAGKYKKQDTDETEVVALCVDAHTPVLCQNGEQLSPAAALALREGEEIMVDGDKTKQNVIRAHRVRLNSTRGT
jgi:hypothetical protein